MFTMHLGNVSANIYISYLGETVVLILRFIAVFIISLVWGGGGLLPDESFHSSV